MAFVKDLARTLVPRSLRNWLRSPSASFLWLWGEVRYRFGSFDRVAVRPDFSLVCHPLAYRLAYFAQDVDPLQTEEFEGFVAECAPGMILFDIGCHFGLFSLAAIHYGGPGARAVAVDPSPMAIRMIEIQSRLNRATDQLRIVHACVSDTDGNREMVSVGIIASGFFVAPGPTTRRSELTRIPSVTLDGLVAQSGLQPTHVKIDVEGAEEAVLQGGRRLLTGSEAPLLFIELHNEMIRGLGRDPGAVLDLLAEFRYSIYDFKNLPLSRDQLLNSAIIRFQARKSR